MILKKYNFNWRRSKKRHWWNIKDVNPNIWGTGNGKTMILSNCAIGGSKKSKFIKKQEANGLLSSLGTKTPSSKITLVDPLLF